MGLEGGGDIRDLSPSKLPQCSKSFCSIFELKQFAKITRYCSTMSNLLKVTGWIFVPRDLPYLVSNLIFLCLNLDLVLCIIRQILYIYLQPIGAADCYKQLFNTLQINLLFTFSSNTWIWMYEYSFT